MNKDVNSVILYYIFTLYIVFIEFVYIHIYIFMLLRLFYLLLNQTWYKHNNGV